MNKIKILHCGEANGALSGFGKYSKELFNRLSQNDRFELAELSSFATVQDNKLSNAKWPCYPVGVSQNDPRYQTYTGNPENKYGFWRFERVLLDFKPDIVMDVRDPWNMFFEHRSPYRDMYHWVISPTVDSYPQQDEWIEIFNNADGVFTYSDFGFNVLKEQSNGSIRLERPIYCGVDQDIYKPMDKKEIRAKYGLPQDAFIIGTVMRNQRRKLYPELFKMFRILLDKYKDDPIVQNAYLYVHTSYPDFGWDIPSLLRDYGIANRVIFTYYCKSTKKVFCSHYEGAYTYSSTSNALSGKMPNVSDGLTENDLAEIFNLFDLYIQYASNEGCGIPMLEAASCGIPIAGIDYSATSDNVRLTNGTPLSCILRFDPDTMAFRGVPLEDKNVDEIYSFISMGKEEKINSSIDTYKKAKIHFNWDNNAKIWSDYFERITLKDRSLTWNRPARNITKDYPREPENLTNFEYVLWLAKYIAKQEKLAYSYLGLSTLASLSAGVELNRTFTRKNAYDRFKSYGDNLYEGEDGLRQIDKLKTDDFIEFAKCWSKDE